MLNIIFPKKSPTVAGFQFDAVIEDTFEASIELTRYPIESGVQVNDHRIINPQKYYITGAIGSKPIKPLISAETTLSDLAGIGIGALSNLMRNNPYVAIIAGLSSGFLAGSTESRASAALDNFMQLMRAGLPFDVDAVDLQLRNMVITKISRTRDPENEEGLILVMEIQELITLSRINEEGGINPTSDQLNEGDPSQTSCTREANRGEQIPRGEVSTATSTAVRETVIIPTTLPPLR